MKDLCNNSGDENNASKKSFPYPSCYNDEQRIHALMAPFRERHVNPENYDSKLKFWENCIFLYCEFKGEPKFNKKELQDVLSKGVHSIYALDTVVDGMISSKKIRSLPEYMYNPNDGWKGWIINNFIRKPLAWGAHKLKSNFKQFPELNSDVQYFVHLHTLDNFCKDLEVKTLQQQQGRLVSYNDFKELVNSSLSLSEDGLKLCLYTLYGREKIGLKFSSPNDVLYIHFIKIPSSSDDSINITEADLASYNLKVCQGKLLQQINELESEVKQSENKVLEYISQNRRYLAEPHLRKKRFLENKYKKRCSALQNIETLLNNIADAKTNGEILHAYQSGSKALQTTLKESGLQFEKIDDIISEVRETMENYEDLQDSISNIKLGHSDMGETIGDDELEAELNILINKSQSEEHVKNDTDIKMATKQINICNEDLLSMLKNLDVESNSPQNTASKGRVLINKND
ncbi:charged multivesicular body protein 7-like [Teleopsis dalmanni]|uniref:charged multivesicular body protein 7-like n=1 Tax=Teleopsis dalmanni TaxID=139649 RepID=UPI0018CCE441|nr:charged multivesicular body protein 7-like [Teleopsis dalmanni]